MTPLGAILRAKHRIARHTVASVRRESKLKVAFVSISAVLLWIGIFQLARFGFRLFEDFGNELLGTGAPGGAGAGPAGPVFGISDLIVGRLLSVFALALFVMLIFSNALVAYSTLYRSREVGYLVLSPIPTSTLFLGRFYECVTFSSWASAYLGSPVLLAYGLETGAPPLFFLSLLAFYLPFVVIPAAVGATLAMVLVRLLARRRRGPWVTAAAVAVAVLFVVFRGELRAPDFADVTDVPGILAALGSTQSPFLPSQWLAQGVLSAAAGDGGEAVFQLLLLTANALFLVWLATGVAELVFFRGWSDLDADGGDRRHRRGLLGRLDGLLRPLPQPTRALVVKDLRLFWRDPAQWTQFVLFFGVMALYVANVRGARSFATQDAWRAWGTLLNLGASMLILASLTTRFIYPLISLEGRRFWILGLAPLSRRRVVWQKFWLSVVSTAVFTVSLALLSAFQLGLDRVAFTLSVLGVVATTVALSGLAVGLGSLYPNFEEDNPSKIVSGMGGTLNFLLSMVYIVLVGAGQAVVLLWPTFGDRFGAGSYPWAVAGAVLWIALLTAVTCGLPLALGIRNLERAEL